MIEEPYPPRIGGFELIEKVGEGAMGVVYKARQESMDRTVAVKILSRRLARNPKYVKRFLREARSAASLSHPAIVTGIDVGEDQGYHYFAMEFIEGRTVQRIIEDDGPLAEKQAIRIAMTVCDALHHAWDRGLIHRDVKPGNIVIAPDNSVKITDLGLAKYTIENDVSLTDTGTTVGTAYYISPEQARGDDMIDIRTDIYSLGCTLFHMVTGEPPYTGTPVAVMTQHVSAEVPDPGSLNSALSDGMCDIIRMAMSKDQRDRYTTPGEMMGDLRRLMDGAKPRLARSDAAMNALSDAAEWEDKALPQVVTREQMRALKKRIGWGGGFRISNTVMLIMLVVFLIALVINILILKGLL